MLALCLIPLLVLGVFALAHRYRGRFSLELPGSWPGSDLARRLKEVGGRAIHAFSGAPRGHLFGAATLAFVQCVLDAASALAFAWSLGLHITLLDALWINVLSYLAILLPISIAGLGVREAAVILALAPLGIAKESAIALALLMFSATLLNALIGGVLQLVVKPRASAQLAPSSVPVRSLEKRRC
jgi:glycosyltransferase 2 family protein